jgi:hypothetical protein
MPSLAMCHVQVEIAGRLVTNQGTTPSARTWLLTEKGGRKAMTDTCLCCHSFCGIVLELCSVCVGKSYTCICVAAA